MANYTADGQGAPIAPDPGQLPDAEPVIDLPADAEVASAASVNPIFQTLANHIAWLYQPQAAPTEYDLGVRKYRNAKGQVVSYYDYFGLLRKARQNEQRFWGRFAENVSTASGGFLFQAFGQRLAGPSNNTDPDTGWSYGIFNSTAYTGSQLIQVQNPAVVTGRATSPGRTLKLSTQPSVIGDMAALTRTSGWCIGPNVLASLEWTIAKVIKQGTLAMGWRLVDGAYEDPDTMIGLWFRTDEATGNWFLHADNGISSTNVDTGIAATDTPHEFRLVWCGAELEFGNADRIFGYIDGVMVADIVGATLPVAGAVPAPYWAVKNKVAVNPAARIDVSGIVEQVYVLL
jgi:hypothetical protein